MVPANTVLAVVGSKTARGERHVHVLSDPCFRLFVVMLYVWIVSRSRLVLLYTSRLFCLFRVSRVLICMVIVVCVVVAAAVVVVFACVCMYFRESICSACVFAWRMPFGLPSLAFEDALRTTLLLPLGCSFELPLGDLENALRTTLP